MLTDHLYRKLILLHKPLIRYLYLIYLEKKLIFIDYIKNHEVPLRSEYTSTTRSTRVCTLHPPVNVGEPSHENGSRCAPHQ